jgi:hypothetical protein
MPRAEGRGERTAEARAKELKDIEQYQRLVNEIDTDVSGKLKRFCAEVEI